MCSPAICPSCEKITYTGCGMHADMVLGSFPEAKRCTCR